GRHGLRVTRSRSLANEARALRGWHPAHVLPDLFTAGGLHARVQALVDLCLDARERFRHLRVRLLESLLSLGPGLQAQSGDLRGARDGIERSIGVQCAFRGMELAEPRVNAREGIARAAARSVLAHDHARV